MYKLPHVIPYQGSKRKIADRILDYAVLDSIDTFYEPFAGSAAITLTAAARNLARKYVIGEKLDPLARLWELIIFNPEELIAEYTQYWHEQLDSPREYYFRIRDYYNSSQSPSALFYLIARCVKNSIRFNPDGKFNQSPDNRRLGMKPEKLRENVMGASKLLMGRTRIVSGDFRTTISKATPQDLIYFDPPWGGLDKNPRYAYLLDYESMIVELDRLNLKHVPYLLSFDGMCGDRSYVKELPGHLGLFRTQIDAGRSTQATLLGRNEVTVESLYLSPALTDKYAKRDDPLRQSYHQLTLTG